jgi:tRNA A-37 threonylcarbamoyl transferase component Bud32
MSFPPTPDIPVSAATLAGMGRTPGPFSLALDGESGNAATVHCAETVRALPGKRLVCRGSWQQQPVYVKVYFGGDRHWLAERHGLRVLHERNIAAAALLHAGTADGGALHILVLAEIAPAETLAQAWQQAGDATTRERLLKLALLTLAQHHRAGLEQRDIHLNNFLLASGQLVTLDGGGIRVSGKDEVSEQASCDNLARFFAQLYPRHDALVEAVLPDYRAQRGWDETRLPTAGMLARIKHYRRKRQRQYLKKIFRECSAFICERHWRSVRICDRHLSSPALQALLADPDASLQPGSARYLKQGNTSTLWSVMVDGRQLVVKRYNIKGPGHRLNRALRRTRAAISWENAHRLAFYGILGARPVALREQRFGPLRGRAWLIMEYVGGEDITHLCETADVNDATTRTAIQRMTTLLTQLAECRITHGDMKGTNFIQTPQGIAVIDLDAMREHGSGKDFLAAQRRDLRRFMRNWQACPDIDALFRASLQNQQRVTTS